MRSEFQSKISRVKKEKKNPLPFFFPSLPHILILSFFYDDLGELLLYSAPDQIFPNSETLYYADR